MEVRSDHQDQEDQRMLSSFTTYNPPANSTNTNNNNRDSSFNTSSTHLLLPSFEERRIDQGHHLNPQPTRNLEPTPDPDPAPAPAPAPAPTEMTNSRLNSRSSPTGQSSSRPVTIKYRECQKNHAASMGGLVVDGCGEFMPSGDEGTLEALKCAACECHRNFHRREVEGDHDQGGNYHYVVANNNNTTYYRSNTSPRGTHFPTPPPMPPQLHPHHHQVLHTPTGPAPSMMMIFGGSTAAESSSEDLNMFPTSSQHVPVRVPPLSKKRFRTKFSKEQKEKMAEFAEKLGWRMQKQDEEEVQRFCSQFGVKRKVFKVWMHNNKQAMKKQQT